jgi:hypothetical protein
MSTFLNAQDQSYEEPARFHLEILSPDRTQTLYTYDPFESPLIQPFALQRVAVREPDITGPGGWEFGIKTSNKFNFNWKAIPSGAIVKIKAGRSTSDLEDLIEGVLDNRSFNVRRRFYSADILYSGLGIGHINSHSLLSFKKQPLTLTANPEFKIPNLLDEAFRSTEVLPLDNLPAIIDRGNFNIDDLLNNEIQESLGGLDYTGTMSGLIATLTQASGSGFVIDGKRIAKMRYPNSIHSGHILKPYPGPKKAKLEDANYVSFYMPPLSFGDTIAYDSGCVQAVKLIINNQNISQSGSGEAGTAFLELVDQDLMIQFDPKDTQITDIAFVMSKTGTGHSDIEDALGIDGVTGYIVTDIANVPSSKKIAQFKIPYTSIPDSPHTVTDVRMTMLSPVDVDKLHWIYIASSGINTDSTVRLYTDGDTNTQSTPDNIRRIGHKSPPTGKENLIGNEFWKNFSFSNAGPMPLFNFFANQEIALYVADDNASKLWTPNRPREIQVDAPFIKDIKTGYQYARAYLQFASKKKVTFNDIEITLPLKWIHPLEMIDVIVPEYGYPNGAPLTCEVISTGVEANVQNLEKPLGFDTVKVSMIGYISASEETAGFGGVCLNC